MARLSITDDIAGALARLDWPDVRAAFQHQNDFVHLPECFPPSVVEALVAEVERVRPAIHRSYIPRHKKGGSVSYYTLREQAPVIVALYRSAAFLQFVRTVTG